MDASAVNVRVEYGEKGDDYLSVWVEPSGKMSCPQYEVTAFGVAASNVCLQRLASEQTLSPTSCSYGDHWVVPTGGQSRGLGTPDWALWERVATDYPDGMYVCVDVFQDLSCKATTC
jgi:hypothetical protein